MPTLVLALMAGAAVFLALGPGPPSGRPTALARLYARLGAPVPATPPAGARVPWVRRLPLGPLVRLVQPVFTARYRQEVERRLRIARLDGCYTLDDIVAMKLAAALGTLLYGFLMYLKQGSLTLAFLTAALAGLGFIWPDTWLAGRARRRQEQIRRELPAMLSALAVALEAGLHLWPALGEAARGRQGALAHELRQAVASYERGVPPMEALEAMTRRLEVPELTVVLTSLFQAFARGSGHVVATVRAQAAEAWQRRRRRAEALAQTASMKLFLPMALLALPGFMVFLLGPAVLRVIEFFH